MTARRLWIAAGALIAVVTGLVWWQRTADRAALVAEIEASIAANRVPPRPAPTPEELETGKMYARAVELLVPVRSFDEFLLEANSAGPADPLPHAAAFVAENAETLSLLDQAAARSVCAFSDDALLASNGPITLSRLLGARGRLELRRGDLPAALRTVRVLRTTGRHLGTIVPRGFQPRTTMLDLFAEFRALELLDGIAVHPGLDPATCDAAEAATKGPFAIETWIRDALSRDDWFDRMCLWVLGPDGEAWATDRERSSGIGARWDEMVRQSIREGVRSGKVRLPSAGDIREMRGVAASLADAALRRDMAALRPKGPLDAAFDGWSEGGLGLNTLGAPNPQWFRSAVRCESRLAVVRAALEVRKAQFREGRPPATIERLDPFDGKPLRYLVGPGDGWVVGSRCWPEDDKPIELRYPGSGK